MLNEAHQLFHHDLHEFKQLLSFEGLLNGLELCTHEVEYVGGEGRLVSELFLLSFEKLVHFVGLLHLLFIVDAL